MCERRQDAEGMRVVIVLALCDFIKCICIFSLQHETIKIQFSSIRLSFVFVVVVLLRFDFVVCVVAQLSTVYICFQFSIFSVKVGWMTLSYPFAHFSYGYVLPKNGNELTTPMNGHFCPLRGFFRIKNSRHKKRDSNKQ